MSYLNHKRGRYLLTAGFAELGLGVSYAASTTESRATQFAALPDPFGLEVTSRGVGMVVLVCAVVVMASALTSTRAPRVEHVGWFGAAVAPALLTGVWSVIAVLTTPLMASASMLGAGVLLAVTVSAAALTHRRPVWVTLGVLAAGLGAPGAWVALVVDPATWSAWATSLIYGGLSALVWGASDWPNPPAAEAVDAMEEAESRGEVIV